MTKASDNDYPSILVTEQGSAPANPAASHQRLYIRTSDHTLVTVNSSGTVSPVGGSATSVAAHGARAKRASSNFSIGNNTLTAVQFDAEDHDTDTIHDNSTNPSRMTIPTISGVTTGLWMVTASGYVDLITYADCQFKVNGSTVISFARFKGDAANLTGYALTTTWVFSATDYVENFLRTPTGAGNAVFDTTAASPNFEVAFLGKVT